MMNVANVAKLALEPLARLLRREQQNNKEVHLVLDDGAQEVLRWSGGVEGAVADLGVASVRALPAAGEPCPCDGSVVVVALCDAFDAKRCAAFAAAARAVVAASSAADAAAARDRFAGDGSVVVEEAPLLFSAPFGGGDDSLPQFFALADATSARCFPVLPWDVAAEPERWRADDVDDVSRARLKHLATRVADATRALRLDASKNAWSLGRTSALVGQALALRLEAHAERSPLPLPKAALVLVDRTADLAAACAASPACVDRALRYLPRAAPRSADVALGAGDDGTKAGAPLSAVENLRKLYGITPSLAAGDRRLVRSLAATKENDAALELIAAAANARCKAAGKPPPRPKPGRGKGAEATEQLKALLAPPAPPGAARPAWGGAASSAAVAVDVEDLAAAAFCCVEATQRTRKGGPLEHVLALQTLVGRLADASDAGLEELLSVVAEAAARAKLPALDALAVAVQAAARCGVPGGAPRALDALAACVGEERRRELDRLPALAALAAALPPRPAGPASTRLGAVVEAALAGAEDHGLAPVGGELATFGAAAAGALGIGRFLKANQAARRVGDGAEVLVFFVIGGLTLAELRDVGDVLLRHPGKRVVLGSTGLATADAVAARLFPGF